MAWDGMGLDWMAWHGMARHGMARHGMARHGMARHGMAWHGAGWYDMAWGGMVWGELGWDGMGRGGARPGPGWDGEAAPPGTRQDERPSLREVSSAPRIQPWQLEASSTYNQIRCGGRGAIGIGMHKVCGMSWG